MARNAELKGLGESQVRSTHIEVQAHPGCDAPACHQPMQDDTRHVARRSHAALG